MAQFERIGRYEIRLQIGRGAMGTVFEGFDPAIGRRVAIKTLRTELFEQAQLRDVLARFKREAQSAGRLSHPHIVTIYEYGEESETPYIAMEYIKGTELGAHLTRGARFSLEEVVRLMSQLLGALSHAHENGVVHRDLKPANMFLVDDGSLKVVDFGIARVESSDLTDTGAMLGTPAYMSPEQCLGTRVDQRSDIFSAGVILYQLLTGDKPFTGSVTTIIQKVLRQDPLAPSDLNPTISTAWDRVVARAMAKNPEARYESAKHFLEALKLAHQSGRDVSVSIEVKSGRNDPSGQASGNSDSLGAGKTQESKVRRDAVDFNADTVLAQSDRESNADGKTSTVSSDQSAPRSMKQGTNRLSRALAISIAVLVIGAIGSVTLYQIRESERNALDSARTAQSEAEQKAQREASARTAAEAKARAEADARGKAEAVAAQALTTASKETSARETATKVEAERRLTERKKSDAIAKVEAEHVAAARAATEKAAIEKVASAQSAAVSRSQLKVFGWRGA